MNKAYRGLRLHIGIFGRRNAGKSSLLNAITNQQVSIVSEQAGTTTDPVEKPMEFLPLGPVVFIDTAGIDDAGNLGEKRVKKTRRVFERTDLGVVVVGENGWGEFEELILEKLQKREVPLIVVFNKTDVRLPDPVVLKRLAGAGIQTVQTNTCTGQGLLAFRQALLDNAPGDVISDPEIITDLVGPGELCLLVIPVDKEAPKGRIIMPQVQTLRNLLDVDAQAMVTTDTGLESALARLKEPPKLVVTDSQAFEHVANIVPDAVPLTSFSILYSRFKGDLATQIAGTMQINSLLPGDRVLIAEACSHHPIGEDIGRVKIPRMLQNHVGGDLHFDTVQGFDFPSNLGSYQLVVHCGACTFNRKAVVNRIFHCNQLNVPITNYGLTISFCLGILERALRPFQQCAVGKQQHDHPAQPIPGRLQ